MARALAANRARAVATHARQETCQDRFFGSRNRSISLGIIACARANIVSGQRSTLRRALLRSPADDSVDRGVREGDARTCLGRRSPAVECCSGRNVAECAHQAACQPSALRGPGHPSTAGAPMSSPAGPAPRAAYAPHHLGLGSLISHLPESAPNDFSDPSPALDRRMRVDAAHRVENAPEAATAGDGPAPLPLAIFSARPKYRHSAAC